MEDRVHNMPKNTSDSCWMPKETVQESRFHHLWLKPMKSEMRRTRLGCPGAYLSGPCCAAAGSRHGCSKQRHDCERGSRSRPPDAARWCERPLAPTAGAAGAVLRTPGRSVSALGRDKSTPSPTSSTARQPNSAAWLLRYKAQSRPSSPSLQAGGDKPAARS